MSDLKQCREAFEHWFSDEGESPRAIIRSGDSYRLAAACSAWNAWQACWAARTQPEATAPVQDLSAAILALPLPSPLNQCHPLARYSESQVRNLLKAAAALASSVNALSAGDRVDAVDAQRYRFLRGEKDVTVENGIPWVVHIIRDHGIPTSVEVHGDMLDVIVDRAILQSQKAK